jgi:hypothetical protein
MFVYIMFFLGHIRSIKTLLVRRSSTASVFFILFSSPYEGYEIYIP